jgi:hypothetical protein
LEQVFAGLIGWDMNKSPSSIGVAHGCGAGPASSGPIATAFRWAHASWDNTYLDVPDYAAQGSAVTGGGDRDLTTPRGQHE